MAAFEVTTEGLLPEDEDDLPTKGQEYEVKLARAHTDEMIQRGESGEPDRKRFGRSTALSRESPLAINSRRVAHLDAHFDSQGKSSECGHS
jgi:hypothetical protein